VLYPVELRVLNSVNAKPSRRKVELGDQECKDQSRSGLRYKRKSTSNASTRKPIVDGEGRDRIERQP